MTFITHIRLSPPTGNDHEHITNVQWKQTPSGNSGSSTTSQMVTFIDGGGIVHVTDGVKQAAVLVVRPATGNPYLRTHADGRWTNNLLALPRY